MSELVCVAVAGIPESVNWCGEFEPEFEPEVAEKETPDRLALENEVFQ